MEPSWRTIGIELKFDGTAATFALAGDERMRCLSTKLIDTGKLCAEQKIQESLFFGAQFPVYRVHIISARR